MEQLVQQLGSGKMEILEVPIPIIGENDVLIRNHYSVISPGTEGKTVRDARKGYLAKAVSRQKEVKDVINLIREEGIRSAYGTVMNKLNAPSSLGYSCAGEVIAIGEKIRDLNVGDYVAAGGEGAVHADIVSVSRNLCVKVEKGTDLKLAAFTAMASVAIQGIRQADLRMGENCIVIGLGLLGMISAQILEAAGVSVTGIDIDPEQVHFALEHGMARAYARDHKGISQLIHDQTGGYGADAVIIAANAVTNDPVEFAGQILRKKGRVIIMGTTQTNFSRSNYYRKELEIKMSTSYGPGRYDNDYETKGIDYPIGYVRFTENRNMQTYLGLIASGKMNPGLLITHSFKLLDAPAAYQMILMGKEKYAGILIQYDVEKSHKSAVSGHNRNFSNKDINVGIIGIGSFAQNVILPGISGKCNPIAVASAEGNISKHIATKYGFQYCADTGDQIIEDDKINTIFILTRHNLHAEFVVKALKRGKTVYVEKPLAMNSRELLMVKKAYEHHPDANLMLGFNRRFSKHVRMIKESITNEQVKAMNLRINAGSLPPGHWVHDPEVGGGRIIGEVCHFIDLAMFLAGSPITAVKASNLENNRNLSDTVIIILEFLNGSVASINYFSNGNMNLKKEYIEVFCNGFVYVIDDFKKLIIYGNRTRVDKLSRQDKGHRNELDLFLHNIKQQASSPISFDEIYISSLATLAVLESIQLNRTISL